MILELLGTRIIGPFYGASLYIWSALIVVTLIALALGYYVGGYIADRFAAIRLGHILLLAALAIVIIPFSSSTVLSLTNTLGLRTGSLLSALILFTLPLTLLAMIGPFAIKQVTNDLKGLGRSVGLIYAVSTAGSVFATLLLSFVLLPHFGTRAIMLSLSLILLVMGLGLILSDKKAVSSTFAGFQIFGVSLLIIVLAGQGYAHANSRSNGFQVLSEVESIYGWVRVVDDERNGFRLLLSDLSMLSAVEKTKGHSLLTYQQVLDVLPSLRSHIENALLIGLGGGHVAKNLNNKLIKTDTIEIDPAVADAALKYFDFKPVGQFIVGDARAEIKVLQQHYDYIIHDCFTGGAEPTHLLTQEMFSQLRNLLTEQGILALNYVGFTSGEGSDAVASVYKTLRSVFPEVRILKVDKSDLTDFIFLASLQPIMLDASSSDLRVRKLAQLEFAIPKEKGILITDDYNPMESKQVRKAEWYRRVFLERIDNDLLFI